MEYVIAGLIAALAFLLLNTATIDLTGSQWKTLYDKGIIDMKEYKGEV